MSILSNLQNAFNDPATIYGDLLGDNGATTSLFNGDLDGVLESAAGSGGVLEELTTGDGLGLGYILADDFLGG